MLMLFSRFGLLLMVSVPMLTVRALRLYTGRNIRATVVLALSDRVRIVAVRLVRMLTRLILLNGPLLDVVVIRVRILTLRGCRLLMLRIV